MLDLGGQEDFRRVRAIQNARHEVEMVFTFVEDYFKDGFPRKTTTHESIL